MSRDYLVELEIAGPYAMWSRPDTGSVPTSAPAPSFSAVKGLFESILMHENTIVIPTKTEICCPVIFHRYVTNYGGPLRKGEQVATGSSFQLMATVLIDVCYRLYARVEDYASSDRQFHHNSRHGYQDQFQRRLRRGQWFRVPCLGWSEFLPSYVGPFREETIVQKINEVLPSQLFSVFDLGHRGKVLPQFQQNVEIRNGILCYGAEVKDGVVQYAQ